MREPLIATTYFEGDIFAITKSGQVWRYPPGGGLRWCLVADGPAAAFGAQFIGIQGHHGCLLAIDDDDGIYSLRPHPWTWEMLSKTRRPDYL